MHDDKENNEGWRERRQERNRTKFFAAVEWLEKSLERDAKREGRVPDEKPEEEKPM